MERKVFNWTRIIIWLLGLALVFAASTLWQSYQADSSGDLLKVHFLDVGQGDAELISKGDFQILIDGGPDDKVLVELGKVMPRWDRKIEIIILTHPHADHLVGLNSVLDHYEIGEVYGSGVVSASPIYLNFLEKLKQKNFKLIVPEVGSVKELTDVGRINFLWPGSQFERKTAENLNNSSLVLRFCDLQSCFLFAGDAEIEEQQAILEHYKDSLDLLVADVYKIPHHGSKNAVSREFIAAVAPRYAVFEVGAQNQFGHPSENALEEASSFGAKILRTDQEGTFVFTVKDGRLELQATP